MVHLVELHHNKLLQERPNTNQMLDIMLFVNFLSFIFAGTSVGEGTFGKVKLGKHILTGEKVAVKILEKDRISDMADVERVAREIHILKMIRH